MLDSLTLAPETINTIAQSMSYLGLFFFAALAGYIIPIPEEMALLIIGYVSALGPIKLHWAVALSCIAVIIGDNVLYFLSLKGSRYIEWLKKRMRKNKLIQYEHIMHEHIGKTIFFIRFIVGVRFFGPVLAGTLKVRWRRFFFINAAASIIHVIFFEGLGYHFHKSFLVLVTQVEIVRHVLFFFSVALFGLVVTFFVQKKYLKKFDLKIFKNKSRKG